jgi:hypothetical protein
MLELLTKLYELIKRNEDRLERIATAQEKQADALDRLARVVEQAQRG